MNICIKIIRITERKIKMWTKMDAIRELKTVIFINYQHVVYNKFNPKLINFTLISIH